MKKKNYGWGMKYNLGSRNAKIIPLYRNKTPCENSGEATKSILVSLKKNETVIIQIIMHLASHKESKKKLVCLGARKRKYHLIKKVI